jgi:hypothetical protein
MVEMAMWLFGALATLPYLTAEVERSTNERVVSVRRPCGPTAAWVDLEGQFNGDDTTT